jgi:DnaJ-class molecular chaperone
MLHPNENQWDVGEVDMKETHIINCGRCNGTGKDGIYGWVVCPDCDGVGKIEVLKPPPLITVGNLQVRKKEA